MALPPHHEGIANPFGSIQDIEDYDPQRLEGCGGDPSKYKRVPGRADPTRQDWGSKEEGIWSLCKHFPKVWSGETVLQH